MKNYGNKPPHFTSMLTKKQILVLQSSARRLYLFSLLISVEIPMLKLVQVVLVLELFNTSASVCEFLLTCKEWMAR